MKKLTLDNLDDLATGSAILGSGGGGDTTYAHMMAKYQMEKKDFVSLINFSELKADDLILPIGIMGAPMAEVEKILNGDEFINLFENIEKSLNKKISVIMPFEIGGANAFIPLMVASQMGLPVLDADAMGRAFPEGQMNTCNLLGAAPSPGFVTDCLGNTVIIYSKNSGMMEKISRHVTVAMGSIAAFGFYPISGFQAEKCTLHKSISKAIAIGKAHRKAREAGNDPLEAILNLCKGIFIGSGKVMDIDRAISRGFLNGTVTIHHKEDRMELAFQNEYLIAKRNGKIVATTPDILMLLEQDTGTPVTSESLQYGLKVNLIALSAPNIWTTPAGLELVGPRHFGYEVDYQPIHKPKQTSHLIGTFTYGH